QQEAERQGETQHHRRQQRRAAEQRQRARRAHLRLPVGRPGPASAMMRRMRSASSGDRRGESTTAATRPLSEPPKAVSTSRSPLLAMVVVFLAVLRAGAPAPLLRHGLPAEAARPDRCTWACHNHGCPHRPVLPPALTGDDGLYGLALRALHHTGGRLVPGGGG